MNTDVATTDKPCAKCGSSETFDGGYCIDCVPRLEIPEEAWGDPEADGSCLRLSIHVRGLGLLHLPAFRVGRVCRCGGGHGRMVSSRVADEMGCADTSQEPDTDHEWMRESYDQYCVAAGQNEPWYELEIRGRRYVIFACPGS